MHIDYIFTCFSHPKPIYLFTLFCGFFCVCCLCILSRLLWVLLSLTVQVICWKYRLLCWVGHISLLTLYYIPTHMYVYVCVYMYVCRLALVIYNHSQKTWLFKKSFLASSNSSSDCILTFSLGLFVPTLRRFCRLRSTIWYDMIWYIFIVLVFLRYNMIWCDTIRYIFIVLVSCIQYFLLVVIHILLCR